MPSFGSGEMFGATKVPNGVFSSRPPASSSCAAPSDFGPCMAGRAAAGMENALAARRIAGPERGGFGRAQAIGHRQQPERRRADRHKGERRDGELLDERHQAEGSR